MFIAYIYIYICHQITYHHFKQLIYLVDEIFLKKVPITVSYGQVLVEHANSLHDYVDVSNRSCSTINLRLSDSNNNDIDLNNADWSCSLNFIER